MATHSFDSLFNEYATGRLGPAESIEAVSAKLGQMNRVDIKQSVSLYSIRTPRPLDMVPDIEPVVESLMCSSFMLEVSYTYKVKNALS